MDMEWLDEEINLSILNLNVLTTRDVQVRVKPDSSPSPSPASRTRVQVRVRTTESGLLKTNSPDSRGKSFDRIMEGTTFKTSIQSKSEEVNLFVLKFLTNSEEILP